MESSWKTGDRSQEEVILRNRRINLAGRPNARLAPIFSVGKFPIKRTHREIIMLSVAYGSCFLSRQMNKICELQRSIHHLFCANAQVQLFVALFSLAVTHLLQTYNIIVKYFQKDLIFL